MSLITDTLNKMKKEQGSGENDDKNNPGHVMPKQ